jgi:hypothetical protein
MNLVETYVKLIKGIMDEDGVYPQQAIVKNDAGQYQMLALAVSGVEATEKIADIISENDTEEYIFGIDLLGKDEYGTEYPDLLLIFHATKDDFNIGVLEYKFNNGDIILKEIDWNNEYYKNNAYKYTQYNKSLIEFQNVYFL